ncbi:acyltransferase [Vibrio kanaloae]|nr:acyltransferase [Vibrio kanaloae]TKF19274.1 acyltransferase [Vibrio kanaloae]
MESKNDLFSLFRLIAALLVLYAHAYHIFGLGADPLTSITGIYTGTFAVYVFFVISGFFIIKSAMDRSIPQYVFARIFRIYPALIISNIITIVFIIPVAMDLSWYSFVYSIEAKEYLKINSILDTIKFSITGVFEDNPDQAINGSLWTLPVEVRAYIIALLIVMSGMVSKKSIFNTLFFIAIFINYKFPDFYNILFPIPSSKVLLLYFISGCFLYVNRDYIPICPIFVIIASVFLVRYRFEWSPIVLSMLLSYLVISSGYVLRSFFNIDLKNDYSYGCYLYAYPVSQFSYVFFSEYGFYSYLFFIVVMTMLLSFASWHLIEKTTNTLVRKKIFPMIDGYISKISK